MMPKSIEKVIHKRPGRPATGKDPVRSLRLSDDFIETVDAWAAKQEDTPGRSEAIRRLVELGLASATTGRAKKTATSSKSSSLAAAQIEKMIDPAVPEDEREARKRRLLKGPSEFRDVRKDRKPKK